jgi:cell wall-associated NlpC family hydrolase
VIDINSYLDRSFDEKTYNCYDFVREVWLELTGVDLGQQTPTVKTIDTYTIQALYVANTLIELPKPKDPCIVLLLRKRSIPHVGIYVKNKVLHLSKTGAQFVPLSSVSASFTTVKYYKCPVQ